MKLTFKHLLILLICLIFAALANAQTYQKADTVNRYSDAQIIIYKNSKGKSVSDTIYYTKMKKDISIKEVDVMNVYDEKLKKK